MLEVGNGDLTTDENYAHFSLWALVKAPLVLGNDLRKLTPEIMDVISNPEVIAISQDPLGKQGVRLSYNGAANDTVFGNLTYLDQCDGSVAQQFTFFNGSIISKLTGLCLGQANPWWACGNAASWGGTLYIQPCNEVCSGRLQQFTFNSTLDNSTITSNYKNGDNLCFNAVPKTNGQGDVVLWECSGSSNQAWEYVNGALTTNGGQSCLTVSSGQETWGIELSDGSYGAILFNRAQVAQTLTVNWSDLGFSGNATVRDLWQHADMGIFENSYSAQVNSHGVVFIRVAPFKG